MRRAGQHLSTLIWSEPKWSTFTTRPRKKKEDVPTLLAVETYKDEEVTAQAGKKERESHRWENRTEGNLFDGGATMMLFTPQEVEEEDSRIAQPNVFLLAKKTARS